MLLYDIRPSPQLASLVRLYRVVDFTFGPDEDLPFKAYPPRAEHCLQFYPRDRETVRYDESGKQVGGLPVVLVGQHTTVTNRYVGRDFMVFQVVLQPGAIHHLSGLGSDELTNVYMDARDLFGRELDDVNEQLYFARDIRSMVQVVERFLLTRANKIGLHQRPALLVAQQMLRDEEGTLDDYVSMSCLSHRQFNRVFIAQTGVSPKQFMRLVRFERSYVMKNRHPDMDWLAIAVQCGYHDHQHLSKDYKEFTGYSPGQFFAIEANAPERRFGEVDA